MSRFVCLLAILIGPAVASADATLVVRGDPLPPGAVARFGIPGIHQNEFIVAGGHTPAGSFRVAVAQQKDIRVWAWQPTHARPPIHHLTGHAAEVTLLSLSPNARYLASADKAGEVRVWELATGDDIVYRKPGPAVTAIAVGPGGRRVAVAAGRAVTLQTVDRTIRLREHERDVTALAFSTDGARLATADAKGRITVWKPDGTRVTDLPWEPIPAPKDAAPVPIAPPIKLLGQDVPPSRVIDFGQGVQKLAFSPDNRRLVAGGGTVVRAWDVAENRVLWQHNRHARVDSGGGLIGLSGAMLRQPAVPRQIGRVWDLAFSRDGHYVASSGVNGDVRIVHTEHGEDLREPNVTDRFTVVESRFTGRVGLAFGPDGKSLTMFEGARKFVRETIVGGKFLGSVAGHGSSVTGLAVSPDGKWLASAGNDNRIRVWRIATGECVAEPRPAHGGGRGTAFSPDGKWLVPGGAYHGFSVLERRGDPPTFTEQKGYDVLRWRVHAFLPEHDARLHVVTQYGQSRGVDLGDRKQHPPGFVVNNEPRHIAVSPDGQWIAVSFGYSSSPPRLFAAATGKEVAPLEGTASMWGIDVVAFSPDSRLLAGGGRDGVTLWEVATGKKYLQLGKHERATEEVAFSPDGRLLASGGDRDLKLWEVATGRLLGARRADPRAVLALAFLPQPGRLASAGTNGDVLVWEISPELRQAAPIPKDISRGVRAPAETGYWSKRFPIEWPAGGLAFSPDGHTLAAGTRAGRIQLFDLQTGKLKKTLEGHTSEVRAIIYTPNGKSILSTGRLFDGKQLPVRCWDATTGEARWARGDTGTFAEAIALSPDGTTVYTTGHNGIPRWNVQTGEPLGRVKAYDGRYTGSMALSPDGRSLMVGGQRDVVLWDLKANRSVRTWQATDSERYHFVGALAFSPDSNIAVTTANDGRVRVWDVATGEMRREWNFTGPISSVVFSPKGDLIAFAGDIVQSGMARVVIWDAKTGKELLRLIAHGPRVAWSPDGRRLATGDSRPNEKENYVLVWDVATLLNRR
jgi:WD40 repeat protein